MTVTLPSVGKKETLRERILDTLRFAVIHGNLEPGTQLVETQLASQLAVSRGPLREAIRHLVEEGLLESVPYRGTFVRTLTVRDVEEIYSYRTALDKFAFQQAWDKRDQRFFDELDRRHVRLTRAIHKGEAAVAVTRELELHDLVYERSDHRLLLNSWKALRGTIHFCLALHHRAHQPVVSAHDEYVTAAKGDSRAAMNHAIDRHMRHGLERIRTYLAHSPSAAADRA